MHAFEKASLIITPHVDRPGLLYDILGQFQKYHINLTAILSRPNKKNDKKYHFYIKLYLSSSTRESLDHVIVHIKSLFDIRFLGHY
jgi:prephenate dehydratase